METLRAFIIPLGVIMGAPPISLASSDRRANHSAFHTLPCRSPFVSGLLGRGKPRWSVVRSLPLPSVQPLGLPASIAGLPVRAAGTEDAGTTACQAQICLLHGNIPTAPNLPFEQMNQTLILEFEQIFSGTPA